MVLPQTKSISDLYFSQQQSQVMRLVADHTILQCLQRLFYNLFVLFFNPDSEKYKSFNSLFLFYFNIISF